MPMPCFIGRAALIVGLAFVSLGIATAQDFPVNEPAGVELVALVPEVVTTDLMRGDQGPCRVSFVVRNRSVHFLDDATVRLNSHGSSHSPHLGVFLHDQDGRVIGRIPSVFQDERDQPMSVRLKKKQGIGALVRFDIGSTTLVDDSADGIPWIRRVAWGDYFISATALYSIRARDLEPFEWNDGARRVGCKPVAITVKGSVLTTEPRPEPGDEKTHVRCEIEPLSQRVIQGKETSLRIRIANDSPRAIGIVARDLVKADAIGGESAHDIRVKDATGRITLFFASSGRPHDHIDTTLLPGAFFEKELTSFVPTWKDPNWDGPNLSKLPEYNDAGQGPQTIEAKWNYRLLTDGGPIEREEILRKAAIRAKKRELMALCPEKEPAVPDVEDLWKTTPVAKGAIYIDGP